MLSIIQLTTSSLSKVCQPVDAVNVIPGHSIKAIKPGEKFFKNNSFRNSCGHTAEPSNAILNLLNILDAC